MQEKQGSSSFQICYTTLRGSFLSPAIVRPCSSSKASQGSLLLGLPLTSHPGSRPVTHKHFNPSLPQLAHTSPDTPHALLPGPLLGSSLLLPQCEFENLTLVLLEAEP